MTEIFDALVVGAGATGGACAHALTARGLRVCLIDAGPLRLPTHERYWSWEHRGVPVPDAARARQPVQSRYSAYHGASHAFYTDDIDNPYSVPDKQPFLWVRGRQVGGLSLLWGGQTWRMSDRELQPDWPFGHAELALFYDRVERLLRVRGVPAGLAAMPDGQFLPPAPLTAAEERFATHLRERWPDRPAIPVRAVDPDDRLPGCDWPLMSSLGSTIPLAQATGNLRLLPDTIAESIESAAPDATTRRLRVVERTTGTRTTLTAHTIVLASSTIETIRLLLHSNIGNANGLLGRYLMDHWISVFGAPLPTAWHQPGPGRLFRNCDGLYIPRFRDLSAGYGIWTWMQRCGAFPVSAGQTEDPDRAHFLVIGETRPAPSNRVTLDPSRRDAWGIPVPHIELRYSGDEQLAARDARDAIVELAASAGMEVDSMRELIEPGKSVHAVGGARMGTDPATSVVDPWNRCWEDPRVVVVDGACWPSAGYQNPTLTMMALAMRASERIADEQ